MKNLLNNSILVLLLSTIVSVSEAQTVFNRVDSVKVETAISGIFYKNPWAGGLNSCQLSDVDLDGDGKKDLFVFEASGNKIRTFLNKGTVGTTNYVHAPQYEDQFPPVYGWVLFRDYNCDGKNDLYTYYPTGSGISLYKNVSTPGNLAFVQVTKSLRSYNPATMVTSNIYASVSDLPAIDDIDNDGDLDILTFGFVSNYVEYYKSYSKETYGVCDSNNFHLKNKCWGWFYESANSFNMNLNIPKNSCTGNVPNPQRISNGGNEKGGNKHAGSTLLTLDLNGDTVKELIVGDVDSKYVIALINGGKRDSAHMVSEDTLFPKNHVATSKLNLPVFPAGYNIDVNNDNKKDLLFAPYILTATSAKIYAENANSIWHYRNNGTNNLPNYVLQSKNFLQGNMIEVGEGAYPVFFDHNGDGLEDLIVSNFGYYDSTGYYRSSLGLYENTGTSSNPKFKLITTDYMGLSTHILNIDSMKRTQSLYATFGDVDNDGDKDMIVGELTGKIHLYTNTPTMGVANFSLTKTYVDSIDVGDYSAPQLIDLDRDGKIDIVIGNRWGTLAFHKNIGTTLVPKWKLVKDTLGGIQMKNPPNYFLGFAVPYFFDNGGQYELLVGGMEGNVRHYDNIDGNVYGGYSLKSNNVMGFYEGMKVAPAVNDIDNDGLWDFVVGNYAGGVSLYKQDLITNTGWEKELTERNDFAIYPNPTDNNFTISLNYYPTTEVVEVYNSLGMLVEKQLIMQKQTEINTADWERGVYIISISGNGKSKFKKLVKM